MTQKKKSEAAGTDVEASKSKRVLSTVEEMAAALGVTYQKPPEKSASKSFHKELPGYQAVTDDAIELFDAYAQDLKLPSEVRELMARGLEDVKKLEPVERLTEALSQSIYYQRLEAASNCMDGLYQLTRRIRELSNASPEIAQKAEPILKFMKIFRPGRKAPPKATQKSTEEKT